MGLNFEHANNSFLPSLPKRNPSIYIISIWMKIMFQDINWCTYHKYTVQFILISTLFFQSLSSSRSIYHYSSIYRYHYFLFMHFYYLFLVFRFIAQSDRQVYFWLTMMKDLISSFSLSHPQWLDHEKHPCNI